MCAYRRVQAIICLLLLDTYDAGEGLTSAGGSDKINGGKSAGNSKSEDISNIPKNVGTVDFSDKNAVNNVLSSYQKEWKNLDYEMDCTITSDGRIWITKGSSGAVHPELIETIENGCSLKGSYSYHNHPAKETNYSLSGEDAGFFCHYNCEYSKASDNKFEYYIRRTDITEDMSYIDVMSKFNSIYRNDILQYTMDNNIDIDYHGYHLTMQRLSKELGFEYERKEL